MKKLYVVKKQQDFNDMIKNEKFIKNKDFVIYYRKNNLKYDRFGISVGKKIGNAVIRNKYKRKIRSILDIYRKDYVNFEDYIIIIRNRALNLNYEQLKNSLINLLISKGEKYEK